MSTALPAPSFSGLVTEWTWQPVAIVAAIALAAWYARAARRVNRPWPRGRIVIFAAGLAAFVWATCGFAGAYLDSLFWVWTAQQLGAAARHPLPAHVRPAAPARGRAGQRFLDSRFIRTIGNPLVGPALVPLLSVVLFFGPLPGWAIHEHAVGWIEPLVLVAIGALIVLPLVGPGGPAARWRSDSSLAIGSFELVLDAVPGIALRLHRTTDDVLLRFPRRPLAGRRQPIHDQQIGGAVLWCVAELLDLPFLILVFLLWLRADARDAADIDAVLEAERVARGEPGTSRTRDRATSRGGSAIRRCGTASAAGAEHPVTIGAHGSGRSSPRAAAVGIGP